MKIELGALFLAAFVMAGSASAASKTPINGGQDLTGSWRATVTLPAGSPLCAAGCTYMALATYTSDGTMIQTAGIPGSSAGYGVWKRVGSRAFRAHGEYLLSGAGGVQIGIAASTIDITLESDGRTGLGTFTVVVDPTSLGIPTYSGSVEFDRITGD
jgi:hypothetical protein